MIWRAVLQTRITMLTPLGLVFGCFEDAPQSGCTPGREECSCTEQQRCLSGLVCEQDRCRPAGQSTGATGPSRPSLEDTTSGPGSGSISTITLGSSTQSIQTTDVLDSTGSAEPTSTSASTSASTSTSTSTSTTGSGFEHQVFVTSASWTGAGVVSIEDASARCEDIAGGGSWRAILSDASIEASEHIEIVAPVVNMQGELIAEDADEMWSGRGRAAVSFDHQGEPIPNGELAWVGAPGLHCDDWSADDPDTLAMPGTPTQSNLWLGTGSPIACSASLHLYCISQ